MRTAGWQGRRAHTSAAMKVRGRLDSRGFFIMRPKPASTPREAKAFMPRRSTGCLCSARGGRSASGATRRRPMFRVILRKAVRSETRARRLDVKPPTAIAAHV